MLERQCPSTKMYNKAFAHTEKTLHNVQSAVMVS